ncbi:MAG: Mur ligase family protein, partial [Bacteroidota bacterium]
MNNSLQPSISDLYQVYRNRLVTTDSRSVPPNSLFFALRGERFDGNKYAKKALEAGAAYVVVDDPNVAAEIGERALLVTDSLQALQQLANHHRRQLRMPILAITGSNGKTTTKELVAAVMSRHYRIHFTQGNLNNHIGVPLTLLQIGEEVEMAII